MDFFDSLKPHYPEEVVSALRDSLSKKRQYGLYLNSARWSDEELLSRFPFLTKHPLLPHAYLYDGLEHPLGKSLEHNLGAFYCMDPASMLVPYFLSPKGDEILLDYCAAPGGKSIVASLLLGNEGVILSNDLSYSRSLETSHNVERMGRSNVVVTSGDIASCRNDYDSYFDAILLDAPCSGSAMFRKEPKMMEDWTYEKVLRLQAIQKELLHNAASMLAIGGRIMYSTCSFSYEEDEEVVLSFLKEHPDFQAVPLPDSSLFYHHPSLQEGVHVFPYLHPGEGQFFCLLQHKGEPRERKPAPLSMAPRRFDSFLKEYVSEPLDYLLHNGALYGLRKKIRLSRLSLIRYGVKLCEDKTPLTPDHALATALPNSPVALTESQALAYLRGETFPINEKDGYRLVSYLNLPLGLIKVAKGIAKNHYPKGLRRVYR